MTAAQPDKGGRTEELLREYFLKAGYFAVRSVPFVHEDFDVTDVDIWLYLRPSPLGRERVGVDAKDRGRPKAMERVLWAKGLQSVLGLDRAIVATTDKRPSLKAFGDRHAVLVLDGTFLAKLEGNGTPAPSERLSEEEFINSIIAGREDKLLGQWRMRLRTAKARLLTHLEFDGCNAWLEECGYFIEQILASSRREGACRLLYLALSFLLVGLDFSTRNLAFEPQDARRKAIEEGFRYGSDGKAGIDRSLRLATSLVEAYGPGGSSLSSQLRFRLGEDLQKMPAEILAEYFSRLEVTRDLFPLARAFEARAFARAFTPPSALDSQGQALLGVILDFLKVDRQRFFSSI